MKYRKMGRFRKWLIRKLGGEVRWHCCQKPVYKKPGIEIVAPGTDLSDALKKILIAKEPVEVPGHVGGLSEGCPTCSSVIEFDDMDYLKEFKYCPYCGQKLKRSNNEK